MRLIAIEPRSECGGLCTDCNQAFLLPIYETSRCEACLAVLPATHSTAEVAAAGREHSTGREAPRGGTVRCAQKGCCARYCSAQCCSADAVLHRPFCATLADPRSPLSALKCECDPSCPDRFGALLLSLKCLWRRHQASAADDEAEAERHALFDAMLSCGSTP